jgi:ribonuclease T1
MKNTPFSLAATFSIRSLLLLLFPLLLFTTYRTCTNATPANGTSNPPKNVVPKRPGGGGGGVAILSLRQAPKHVRRMIEHLKSAPNHQPPQGFKGGRVFRNREGTLPRGKTYYEYDVHPIRPGASRGAERLVVDQQKRNFYYTTDHYRTFTQIR